jgi:Ca-activated chloride channel family protein
MSFAHPFILWFIPAYFAFAGLLYYLIRRRSISLPTTSFVTVRNTWRTKTARILRYLPALCCGLMLLALAGPQSVHVEDRLLPSGIDIVVAIDVSGSMAAEDFQPMNRLEVAKDVIADFIQGRPSDRIGLVLFAGKSVTRSPLTLEHNSLLRTLKSVRMGDLPEGTAIGTAILSGLNRLSDESSGTPGKKNSKILVLITDGRNNAGEIHPLDALNIAVEKKVRIYTIGVGSSGPVPFPILVSPGKKGYRYEKVDIDEDLLSKIAEQSGGRYYRAVDPKSLGLLFAQINVLEKSEPDKIQARVVQDRAALAVIPAAALALCYLLLTTIIVRIP